MAGHADTITTTQPARRADAGTVRLSERDIDGLLLCGEHYGAPYDLLALALRVAPDRLPAIVARWRRAGYAETGRLGRGPRRREHVPDAEIHWPSIAASPYPGQVWAVEVELTPKAAARTMRIMTGLLSLVRYAQVAYLTAPAARSVVTRTAGSLPAGEQPRVVIRELPAAAFTPEPQP